eukprot:scaffold101634_cov28-Tisochrysis_lutea.AAC.3
MPFALKPAMALRHFWCHEAVAEPLATASPPAAAVTGESVIQTLTPTGPCSGETSSICGQTRFDFSSRARVTTNDSRENQSGR